ncbi:hypothetical protein PIB30_004054 [Stylosanthes scabra]|uniref:Uncharacterized protein n=1 Tax=Stylosanthes scabra TaxID=79078 RepID=A0ABU6Y2F6_9FABA|nr:hypothetical protein [Stylosanthes scabra]
MRLHGAGIPTLSNVPHQHLYFCPPFRPIFIMANPPRTDKISIPTSGPHSSLLRRSRASTFKSPHFAFECHVPRCCRSCSGHLQSQKDHSLLALFSHHCCHSRKDHFLERLIIVNWKPRLKFTASTTWSTTTMSEPKQIVESPSLQQPRSDFSSQFHLINGSAPLLCSVLVLCLPPSLRSCPLPCALISASPPPVLPPSQSLLLSILVAPPFHPW